MDMTQYFNQYNQILYLSIVLFLAITIIVNCCFIFFQSKITKKPVKKLFSSTNMDAFIVFIFSVLLTSAITIIFQQHYTEKFIEETTTKINTELNSNTSSEVVKKILTNQPKNMQKLTKKDLKKLKDIDDIAWYFE